MDTLHTITLVAIGLSATAGAFRLFARQVLGVIQTLKAIANECGLKKPF
ncbi:hypothetical protein [Rhodopseudomonas sp. RCAM05734]